MGWPARSAGLEGVLGDLGGVISWGRMFGNAFDEVIVTFNYS